MAKWHDDSGNVYDYEEEARESVSDMMDTDDYVELLDFYISTKELLRFIMNGGTIDDFWNHFGADVENAEEDFFCQHYYEGDENEED